MASCLDQCRFLDCLKRKRVKITLFDSQVMGVIQRINLNKTVVLEDVYEVKSGRKLPGVKLFFGHDIVDVEFPFSANQDNMSNVDESHKSQFQSYGNMRMLLEYDDEHEDFINYVVIDELQEKFGPAVTHIQEQKVIGIEAELFGQQEGLCWFKVATKNIVYLFDILLLDGRAFKNGLCMILENHHILKVTHDCRCIASCLRSQFGVSLTNVFDTQVADIMLFYKDTGGCLPDRVSTLQEMVRLHLKVPRSKLFPLWTQEQCTKENPEVMYVRPCPPALLKIMAVSVLHLLPLRLVLLDALMSDYTTLVDSYIGSYQNNPVDVLCIGRNENELPKEAQELEAVRQERLKWAVHRYIVTDEGLLERSSFRPPPSLTNHEFSLNRATSDTAKPLS